MPITAALCIIAHNYMDNIQPRPTLLISAGREKARVVQTEHMKRTLNDEGDSREKP